MKRFSVLSSLCLGLVAAGAAGCGAGEGAADSSSADVVASGATLAPVACAEIPSLPSSPSLSCAKLTVPENRANGARTLELALAVVKAANAGTKAPPLVMITGGPGTPSLGLAAALIPGAPFSALAQDRDVVLVGERGEEGASIRLNCTEFDALAAGIFRSDGTVHPIGAADRLPKTIACHDRLAQEADLSAYDVREMAADVHDAVHALGYAKYSLYGVSFGTGLSQSVAKLYPAEVEAVILDSPVTFWDAVDAEHHLTGNIHLDAARSATDAWRTLFAACASDAGCSTKHPNLEATFRAMLEDYQDHPLAFAVPTGDGDKTATWQLDGALVFGLLTNQFNAARIPSFPSIIEGLRARDPGVLGLVEQAAIGTLKTEPDAAAGLTLSVDCSGWSFAPASSLPTDDVDELVQRFMFPMMAEELDQCAQAWRVPRQRDSWPEFAKPLESATLPMLILPGKFDANTHPFKAEQIHAHLPRSFVHTVPDRGHVTIDSCPIAMMNAFLADPGHGDPDASCLATMTTTWQ